MRRNAVSYKIDDSSSAIGRRYARADELGIPFAIVVDFQTVKDETVTVRERDSTTPQIRVHIKEVPELLAKLSEEREQWKDALTRYPHHTGQEV